MRLGGARKRAFDLLVKSERTHATSMLGSILSPMSMPSSTPLPPNGSDYSLWNAAVFTTKYPAAGESLSLFTWHSASTAFRLAVGYACRSEYAHRFRPNPPPDSACPRGWPDFSFLHLPAVRLPPWTYGAASCQPLRPVDRSSTGLLPIQFRDLRIL